MQVLGMVCAHDCTVPVTRFLVAHVCLTAGLPRYLPITIFLVDCTVETSSLQTVAVVYLNGREWCFLFRYTFQGIHNL